MFEIDDQLTIRAMQRDARARTRGDVLAPVDSRTVYPRYVQRAQGAHIWDADGNRYVDYLLGYGPVILGHAHPRVTSAVVAELAGGNCIAPLWSPRQIELLELLGEVVPGAEAGLLLKTGSDSTSAAVRLARIHTGATGVARWGYNGWHDWSVDQAAGVPDAVRELSHRFDVDDLDALDRVLETRPGGFACVLMMPFEDDEVAPDLLSRVQSIAHRHGALFILDEMRSGFRLGVGGAQKHFGVRSDLATFSKAMANGYSISALTGRLDVLDSLAQTKISSTFFANPADMVAAITTIEILRDTDALDRIWAMGRLLQTGLRELAADSGLPVAVVGYPPMPFLRFEVEDPTLRSMLERAFFDATTRGGVLFHPHHQWFLSAAHSEQDIDATLDVCRIAFASAARVAEAG